MVNRLVLNLSHTANAREHSTFRSRTGIEPPLFATNSMLGNVGAPVRTSFEDDIDFRQGEEGNPIGTSSIIFPENIA